MKKIYSLLTLSFFLFIGYSCDDGSLSHDDVYIPDPVEVNDEDDGFALEPTTNATIRMKIGDGHTHQTIEGFGCAFAEWAHTTYVHLQREEIMKDLFSKDGLNLNIIRGEAFPHYGDLNNPGAIDFGMDREYLLAPNDPSLINNFWGDRWHGAACGTSVQLGQMWITDYVAKKYKDVRFIFSTWSPPAFMKTVNAFSGGSLKAGMESEFANYLANFIKAYTDKFGIKVYAISPSNEPDNSFSAWSRCSWTAKALANFCCDNLRTSLDNAGFNDTKIIYGECAGWGTSKEFTEEGLKARPDILEKNIIVSGHGYHSANDKLTSYSAYADKGISVWNTETSNDYSYVTTWADGMEWAEHFHYYLAQANLNAFVWWAGARNCYATGENLIQLSQGDVPGTSYEKLPRYYTYGHFTKHIPVGSQRVDIETISPEGDETKALPAELHASAYIKDNTYTIVLVNASKKQSFETRLEIEGEDFQNMISYTSSQSVKWKRKKINPSPSGLRSITVPQFSVVTITGKIKKENAE